MTEKEKLWKYPRKKERKERERVREANQVGDTSCQGGEGSASVCVCAEIERDVSCVVRTTEIVLSLPVSGTD